MVDEMRAERTMQRRLDKTEELLARESAALAHVLRIRFYPMAVARAEGARVWDFDGNEYLDMMAAGGAAQTGFGHTHVKAAIQAELDRTFSNMLCCYPSEPQVALGERLLGLWPHGDGHKVWFGATGSDANDCLAKLLPPATGRRRLVSYVGAYHGQTSASAALSGHSAQARVIGGGNVTKAPYPYCYRCLWGCTDSETCGLQCLKFLEDFVLGAVSPAEDTAAVLLEPMQSDGGDIVPPPRYMQELRELCDRHGIWLVFDEVKTGVGRSGRFFMHEHFGIRADAVSIGKPIGGGLPLSGVIAPAAALDQDTYNLYTLGGSPVPCAAGLATLDVLDTERLLENATAVGGRLREGLHSLAVNHPLIGDVRGLGLMVGTELVTDRATRAPADKAAARLVYRCFELGLLVIYCGLLANVIEMTPPLNLTEREADEALAIFEHALADVEAGRFDDAKLARFAGW
jgi:4-aminobutyrate aminotransferase